MINESFEWDDGKAAANERKHGVSFPEAATVFNDPLVLEVFDEQHSETEARYRCIGFSERGRLVLVIYRRLDDSGNVIRMISARRATKTEAILYVEGQA